ncbi:hypothetical protein SAMN06297468_0663 [Altererythrobacter xiamenensis]|uniref:Uncharacterized protein n=1 Tax=Altererythrobacter xiamenensis TaxID=1316679 RepID=A0A1Y6EHS4_9SPHN|nr:hypothetical protein [Altererythrobacter xiamenensis]SMQ62178.1 hypothetical protein SAMN06297468_0663 [Altererythrobacter xiamenensis]
MKRFTTCAAASLAFAFPANATAQDSAADPDHLEELQRCQIISDDGARLACFDAAVGGMVAASEAGEVQVVKKEEVEQTRRGLFGFTMPKIGFLGGDGEEMKLLQSTITGVRSIRRGYILTIEEGSVWQLSGVPSRLRPPKVGDDVEFKKAALGSYFVRINGQIGVKGTRIQ